MPEYDLTVSEYLKSEFGISFKDQVVIAGPCHAEEVALEKQSYLTAAGPNSDLAQALAERLTCHFISCKVNNDLFGVEYCRRIFNLSRSNK